MSIGDVMLVLMDQRADTLQHSGPCVSVTLGFL